MTPYKQVEKWLYLAYSTYVNQQTQTSDAVVPKHLGIIMDGNRRWAKAQRKPALFGHAAGVERLEWLVRQAEKHGIAFVSVYAFSTENWHRSRAEVAGLFGLIETYARQKLKALVEAGVRVRLFGQIDRLPDRLQQALGDLVAATELNRACTLNLGLSYGGRDEILRAIRRIAANHQAEQVTEEMFCGYLDLPDVPDPDLIVRTSGEQRLSNFLTWQSAYSELYFTPVHWPAFDDVELQKALDWYVVRQRRFGR